MNESNESCCDTGLQFFGRISASVSHDIKNYFSIINENAGLLADFVSMTQQQGMPLDPERIKRISAGIQKQIRLADTVVKNMNTFAHSVDKPVATVDLVEDLHIIAELSRRFCSSKRVSVTVGASDSAIIIVGPRFQLFQLFSHCILAAVSAVSAERRLIIDVEKEGADARIRFSGVAEIENFNSEFMDEIGENLLLITGSRISGDEKGEAVEIRVPVSHKFPEE